LVKCVNFVQESAKLPMKARKACRKQATLLESDDKNLRKS